MFETIFTLKQHTPMLHFLHDQPGATLRATELKPKLDRFIVSYFKTYENAEGKYTAAIQLIESAISEKSPSPYRISIRLEKGKTQYYYIEGNTPREERESLSDQMSEQFDRPGLKVISPSPYFANNDKRQHRQWEEVKLGVLWTGKLSVCVSSWDESLILLIEAALPLLLCVENFGTRQTKGFGCFSEKRVNEKTFERVVKNHFAFAAKTEADEDLTELFKQIDKVYKDLRNKPSQRKNPDGSTGDSLLRDYLFSSKSHTEWEKRFVYKSVVRNEGTERPDNVCFVRALLGLPGLYDYPQAEEYGQPKVNIRDIEGRVERFRSPLIFKVHGNWLYMLAHQPDQTMMGREFRFYIGDDPESAAAQTNIPTPAPGLFNIKDFLSFQIDKNKIKNWRHVR